MKWFDGGTCSMVFYVLLGSCVASVFARSIVPLLCGILALTAVGWVVDRGSAAQAGWRNKQKRRHGTRTDRWHSGRGGKNEESRPQTLPPNRRSRDRGG